MGILFWIIFFGAISVLWGLVKRSWNSGDKFKAVAWLMIVIIVVCFLSLLRTHTMKEKRKEWQGKLQTYSVLVRYNRNPCHMRFGCCNNAYNLKINS